VNNLLIVQKFGGTSVANTERIFNAAQRILETYRAGNKVVVVLSAPGDMTDDLIGRAREISAEPSKRELDVLLATGEQQSVALMAMALQKLGAPAVSLIANQAGILSSSAYGNARIKRIETSRLNTELENNMIPIVAGFQAYNRSGNLTTLGRGASDTTAVALAAALQADLCEIYTDVEGVYTADPRVVAHAKKIDAISYDEMLELASLGAKVLHNRCVELAKKYGVKLVVRSSLTRAEGTLVREESAVEQTFVTGVALDKEVSRIAVISLKDEPGVAFKIFSLLAKAKISVDIILQSIGRQNTKDITFTVNRADLNEAVEALEVNKDMLCFDHISHSSEIAKLSVVGAGMATNPGVAAMMFEALYDAGVNIQMISTSEIKISVLIDEKDANKAYNSVHDKFVEFNV